MKLYYSKGACSLAVRILMNELGLTAKFESVNLKTKKTETGEDYLTINSKGAVPALLLDDNTVLTENMVIQQYLADKQQATKLLPAVNDMKRYRALEWLNFMATDLHKPAAALFNTTLTKEAKDSVFIPALKMKLAIVEKQLAKNKFITGDQFTLGDTYLFTILTWVPNFKIQLTEFPNINRYYTELKARPSIQKSLKEEDLLSEV